MTTWRSSTALCIPCPRATTLHLVQPSVGHDHPRAGALSADHPYYRVLIGCPDGQDVIWCYNVARPETFTGKLGYRLVAVFESFPTLDIPGVLHWQANDQFAEEAFTVYDHPKVLIFEKQPTSAVITCRKILGAVDLSNVVHLTPGEAAATNPHAFACRAWRASRRAGPGLSCSIMTGSESISGSGLLLWYLFIFILGFWPIRSSASPCPGWAIRAIRWRVLGLVLLGYFSWMGGSLGLPVYACYRGDRVCGGWLQRALWLGWRQRAELAEEWKLRRGYFLMVEGLFLAFFLFDLLIRIGNPDLWHPAKGGERPMDFSYFNAIIKSTTFPPYDPWFAGGYINYYYYGFVLVATPVKLLGHRPIPCLQLHSAHTPGFCRHGGFLRGVEPVGWNIGQER